METSRSTLTRCLRTGALAAFVALAAGADCGDPVVVPPRTGQVVTGRVILNSTQTDDMGTTVLERIVLDATGMPIELRRGDGMTLQTTSVGGSFHFEAVPNGSWVARTWADPAAPVVSAPVVVNDAMATIADPLRILSSTVLITYPNPFVHETGIGLETPQGAGGLVEFEVLTLGRERVWSGMLANVPPGYFHAHYGGSDITGPPGLYWAHLRDANGDYYDLIFKND